MAYNDYSQAVKDAWEKQQNYGDYSSKYADALDTLRNNISGYGDYNSQYTDRINNALNNVTDFKYDPATDPVYQAYKEQYDYNGQQAMKNTLGTLATQTGGMASSYAANAAAGSYNDYMKQLSAMIPTLSDNAYSRATSAYSALTNADDTAYNRYRDKLNDLYNQYSMYNTADDTDYNRYSDKYSRLSNDTSSANTLYNSNEASRQWEAEYAESKRQFDEQMAYNYASLAASLAKSSGSGSSGSSGKSSSSSKKSSSSSGKSFVPYSNSGYTQAFNNSVQNMLNTNGISATAKALVNSGFSNTEAGDIIKNNYVDNSLQSKLDKLFGLDKYKSSWT